MRRPTPSVRICGTLALLLAGTTAARATNFTSMQPSYDNALLSQFNLITLGNYTQRVEDQGRVAVGGNYSGNGSNLCFNGGCTGNTTAAVDASGASYGALTVFGNLTGGVNNQSSSANISVAGTSSGGTISMNNKGSFNTSGSAAGETIDQTKAVNTSQATFSGTVTNSSGAPVNTNIASAFPFGSFSTNIGNPLTSLAAGLAALPSTPGVSPQALPSNQSNAFFTANNDYTAGGKQYGVITTTLANLATESNWLGIKAGNDAAVFVIVTGTGSVVLPNLNSYADAGKVIFDFVNATALSFGGAWSGTILAPQANIVSQGGVLDGTVVVNSLAQSQELHTGSIFSGDLTGLAGTAVFATNVPEPASLALLGLGVAAAGFARRRA